MQMFEKLLEWTSIYWVTITVILYISFSLLTSLHVVLFKENERTSLAWIGLVILFPVVGGLFYWLFGINRIKRLAQKNTQKTSKKSFNKIYNKSSITKKKPLNLIKYQNIGIHQFFLDIPFTQLVILQTTMLNRL
jgi:hypothetical protein